VGNVASTGEQQIHTAFIGEFEGKGPLGSPGHRRE